MEVLLVLFLVCGAIIVMVVVGGIGLLVLSFLAAAFKPSETDLLKTERDVNKLTTAMKRERWYERKAAAERLGEIGDTQAVESLVVALMDKDNYDSVRWAVAQALDKLGWQPRNDEVGVAYWIAKGQLDRCAETGTLAVEPLITELERQASNKGASRIVDVLAQIGSPAVSPLLAVIKNKSTPMRLHAAQALGKIGDPQAISPIVACLKDWDRQYADSVFRFADGLKGFPTEQVVESLISTMRESDAWMRRKIVWMLEGFKDPRVVTSLIASLKDSDAEVRLAAAKCLEALKDIRAVEPLIASLKDIDAGVRMQVASSLKSFKDARAIDPLIATLRDDNDMSVCYAVASALGSIGGSRAIEPLKSAFRNKGVDTVGVLISLQWQPDQSELGARYYVITRQWDKCLEVGALAIQPLIAALRSEDRTTRADAAKILVRIYRSGLLDDTHKRLVLAQRQGITTKHHDSPGSHSEHDDGRSHSDYEEPHEDTGIGVAFPI